MNIDLPKIKAKLPRPLKNLSRREILSLIGAAIVLLAIPLTVILFRRYQETRIKAFENAEIVGGTVKITNIHAHGFTVSWATKGASTGVVQWGPVGQIGSTAYDDRGPSTVSSTHHVTLPHPPGSDEPLGIFEIPGQTFDLKIVSGNKTYGGTFDNLFNVVGVSLTAAPIRVTTGPELGAEEAAPTVYLSVIFKELWDYTSSIQVQNLGEEATTVTLTFYQQGTSKTFTYAPSEIIPPNYGKTIYIPEIAEVPPDFLGSCKIQSNNGQNIAALVNHHRDVIDLASGELVGGEAVSHRGEVKPAPGTATTKYLPVIFKNLWDYISSIQVQNLGDQPTTVAFTFYQQGTNKTFTYAPSDVIPPNYALTAYLPTVSAVPPNFLGSCKIQSNNGQNIAVLVDHHRDVFDPATGDLADREGLSHRGFANPAPGTAAERFLSVVTKGYHDYTSSIQVQNLGSQSTTVTLTFYQQGTSNTFTYTPSEAIQPNYGLTITPAAIPNLPSDFLGSCKIQSNNGQNIAALVDHHRDIKDGAGHILGREAMSHMGEVKPATGTSTARFLSVIFKELWDYESSIQVQNLGDQPTTVNLTFYQQGTDRAYTYAPSEVIPPNYGMTVYLPEVDVVPPEFLGSCVVQSDNGQNIVALVDHHRDVRDSTSGEIIGKEAVSHTGVAGETPDPIFGEVQKSSGIAAPGAIVYTTVKDSGGTSSAPLSTVANSEGRYVIDLANARLENRSGYFPYDRHSTTYFEDISAQGGVDGVARLKDNPTNNDEPIPTLVLDNQGPTITHTPVTTAPENQDIEIEATITDPSGVASIGFCHRKSDGGMWGCVSLPFTGGLFSTHILAEVVTRAGVDYYITAVDNPGNRSSHPDGAPPAFHHITVVPAADTAPPAAVTDLTVTETTTNSITLTWTAPGDDGNTGTASAYDVRYSDSPITAGDWDNIAQAPFEPTPQPAGATETFTIHTLTSGVTYHFALKTADEIPNWSALSNVATGTTLVNLVCTNAVSPKTFEIAPNVSQPLTASPTGGSGNYTYSWSATGGSFEGSTTSSTATWKAPATATDGQTFSITAGITDTGTQETCSDSATATIEVPGPTLHHVTITPTSATRTVGETQGFSAQAYDAGDSPITSGVTYSWSVEGGIGSVPPTTGQTTTFTAATAGTGSVKVTATLGAGSVSKNAPVTVFAVLSCTNSVSPKTFDIAPNGTRALTATPTGGSGNYGYSWSATGGNFEGSATSSTATWKAPATATNGQTFSITASITDSVTQKTCSDSATATVRIAAAPTLNISLLMQGRKSYPGDSRGSSGTVDIFARRPGGTTKLWEVDDLAIAADGTATGVSLPGLSVGTAYDFLLKGYIHLTVKKNVTLGSENSVNFGTILVGDIAGTSAAYANRDDKVNAFDYEILRQGWETTWNNPQLCPDNYANCKLADFNLDSKVNAFDYDYIFTNWNKVGNE